MFIISQNKVHPSPISLQSTYTDSKDMFYSNIFSGMILGTLPNWT